MGDKFGVGGTVAAVAVVYGGDDSVTRGNFPQSKKTRDYATPLMPTKPDYEGSIFM